MKKLTFLLILFSTSIFYTQSITNTIDTGGFFYIKDGGTTFFKITQSTGEVNVLKSMRLELTGNSTTTGVIFKGDSSFIHDFKPTGAEGFNTFLGINSGNFTMTASVSLHSSYNTGVGYNTLNKLTTGFRNTALGSYALYSNTGGFYNTALGSFALYSNTGGTYNTATGYQSLYSNTGGDFNTATGYQSLYSNTGGAYNTATGYQSLYSNTTGEFNTATGYFALYKNTSGDYNTASGHYALNSNTGGRKNTASGYKALYFSTADSNTAFGYYAGKDITTGTNCSFLGFNAQPSSATVTDEITLGDSHILALRCNVQTITSLSDIRDKKNIKDLSLGLNFIMKLQPRQFNWDKREWYKDNKSDGTKMKKIPTAGFIAQELDKVQKETKADWLNLVYKSNPNKWEATYGNLLPVIVKAIQDLKKENDDLKSVNAKLTNKLEKFEQIQNTLIAEIENLKASKNENAKVVSIGN